VRVAVIYGVSLAVHLGLAGGVYPLKRPPRKAPVSIVVREVKRPAQAPPAPKAPEPPAPPKPAARKVAAARPAPRPAPAAPSTAPPPAAAPDFGLTLGGATGGPGLAVPQARPAAEEAPAPKARALAEEAGCADPPTKPRPVEIVQPRYSDEATAAQIEGKVRVEITVGADGAVTDVKVLEGLGHGLDEKAVEAARASTFTAGSRCGQAVATTFKMSIVFSL
jgi:protein TonB